MNNSVVIREAVHSDWPELLPLIQAFVVEHTERVGGEMLPSEKTWGFYKQMFSDACNGGEAVALVAEIKDAMGSRFVGWHIEIATIPPWDSRLGNKVAQGLGVFVIPAFRGHGIHKELWDMAEKKMYDFGCTAIMGQVFSANFDRMSPKLSAWGMTNLGYFFAKLL